MWRGRRSVELDQKKKKMVQIIEEGQGQVVWSAPDVSPNSKSANYLLFFFCLFALCCHDDDPRAREAFTRLLFDFCYAFVDHFICPLLTI